MSRTERRYVFDTNILVSAALFPKSIPGQALRLALTHGVLLASAETLAELAEVLGRSKFDPYLTWADRETFLQAFADRAEILEPDVQLVICRDSDDDKLIELAVAGCADALVTGDSDLLALSPSHDMPIVNAEGFLRLAETWPARHEA